jgi:beta-glucosidase
MRIDTPLRTRYRRRLTAAGAATVTVAALLVAPGAADAAAATNLALSAVATASSSENVGVGPDKAIDGDPTTRWSSLFTDPQSLTVDLGARATVDTVQLTWEAAHASAYTVETSVDGQTWTKIHDEPTADGGVDAIAVNGATIRLLRITGTARATEYGYSLYEVAVLGTFTEQAVSLPVAAQDLREKGTAQVKVRLNKPAATAVSVGYATADGTATAGQDYVATSGKLTFAAGEVEKTIAVKGIDDVVDEPTETFTVTLSAPSAGLVAGPRTESTVRITDDDVPATDGKPKVIADFEGAVTFGEPEGIFPFGADEDDKPDLAAPVLARDGASADNHALTVKIGAEAWGGFSHNLTFDKDPQDWSGYGGFRFWYKSMNSAPLPPGSGPRMFLEIKDGGANANASELWETSFTDDFDGWKLIEIPFGNFTYRGDYQPVGGINQTLDLTQMWGYAFRPPSNLEATFAVDDIEAYGVALPPPVATIGSAKPAYPVNEGSSATVGITLTTTSGEPLDTDVQVKYATGGGTATAGKDYTKTSGTLTFPLGTPSGAVKNVTVRTAKDRAAEVAETIDLTLTSGPDVRLAKDLPVTVVINAHGLQYLDKRLSIDKRLADLMKRMSLADKVGQMTQAERLALDEADDIATYRLGSLLSGGGSTPKPNTPAAWADMIDGYQLRAKQTPLQIPLIYGVDAVHGHNNLVGATIFPHNIGLGATRDPALVQKVGATTASEVRATGAAWDFSPCLCVAREDRWGRTYESFGEDPALAAAMATIIKGYEGDKLSKNTSVLSTMKHWVGDGGTTYESSTTGGYTVDQGVTKMSEGELWRTQIPPYLAGIKAGSGSLMPSYSSVDTGTGPVKMHGNKHLITDVLKKQLGFSGFVISDWQAIDQIPGDYRSDITTSVNAGLDMIMVPYEYQSFEKLLTEQVTAGAVKNARIDDAVRRILRKKFELGLFENPYADRSNAKAIGSAAHRAVARDAAAKSQTLLKNTGSLLPLKKDAKVYVAGSNADDLGNQAGGWTVSWQGGSGPITPGTSILAGIKEIAPKATVTYSKDASADLTGSDVGVVVVGETPYAEGVGDVGNGRADLSLSAADKAAIDKVCAAMKCAVLVVSGRPQLLDAAQFDGVEAVVASWLPGTEGAGVAQPLFGVKPYTGRLSVTWPRTMAQEPINVGDKVYDPLYAYGWGLRTDSGRARLVAARAALAAQAGARRVSAADRIRLRLAIAALDVASAKRMWAADGSVRNEAAVLAALQTTAALLEGTRLPVTAQFDPIVSVARDIAQARLVAKAGTPKAASAAALTATAEHELLVNHPWAAVRQFTSAWSQLK